MIHQKKPNDKKLSIKKLPFTAEHFSSALSFTRSNLMITRIYLFRNIDQRKMYSSVYIKKKTKLESKCFISIVKNNYIHYDHAHFYRIKMFFNFRLQA